jgi:peptidoglycan/xylan/chitin deacetylase (PgdA/CDA1 family)
MPRDGLERTLRDLVGARRTREEGRPVVLLYHRIGHSPLDPQLLAVTKEHFAEHLQLISERYVPLGLADLVAAAVQGRNPARAVAITFDDGYADNLFAAKPLLEHAGTPATVFVASGYVRGGAPFWWDELERLLLRPGLLPSTLTLEVGRETLLWELGDETAYTSVSAADRTAWTVLDDRDPGPRQRIYRALCARLRVLDETERARALERLRSVAEPEATDAEMPRPMTSAELACLVEGDLVDVGAHTVTHPVLSRLAEERQRDEIAGSRRQLQEVLGRPVASFAYPYGTDADFDETTVKLIREAGFDHACANLPGRVDRRTDPFRLPRFVVRDWSGDELDRRLSALAH